MFTIRNTNARPVSVPSQLPKAGGYFAFFFTVLSLLLATVAAWVTHVVVCIKAASWFLLLFGILAPPVGVIHGIGVWLGVF